MINNEKTLKEFGYDFETAINKNKIFCCCDYCGEELIKNKTDIKQSRKTIAKDSCIKCKKFKTKEVCLKKYGVDNPAKTKETINKMKTTCLSKYGTTSPAGNEAVQNKIKQTCLEKYGTNCAFNNETVQNKIKQTCLEKYGVENPFASELVKIKIEQTSKEKYGKKSFTQTQSYLDKTTATCLSRYGVEHHLMSADVQNKRKKTNLKKYGVEYPSQNNEIMQKILANTDIKTYGKTQQEIKNYLNSLSDNKFEKTSKILNRQEIDLYNKKLMIGIEYCGLFWHNEKSPEPRNKKYHFDKYKNCLDKNIKLITIFEDEWICKKEQCKNFLCSLLGIFQNRIFARKCNIKNITNKEANDFYQKNHIQGTVSNIKNSIGLFHNGQLIASVSLGFHHRKTGTIVLNRLCFEKNTQIIGGASKLLSACKKWCIENNYKKIITWSDNRWSQGEIYCKIGFALEEELEPDYSYVDLNKKFTRKSKQSQKKKPNQIETESEMAIKNNLVKIWDCGKKRWSIDL